MRSVPSRQVLIAAAAAVAAASATGPSSADGRLTMSVRQTFAADTNVQLDPRAAGSFGSITDIGLRYAFAEPGATLSAALGFNYAAFTGDDNSNLEGLFPNVNVSYAVAYASDTTLDFSLGGRVYPTDARRVTLPGLGAAAGADGAGDGGDETPPDEETGDTTDPNQPLDPGEGDVESGARDALAIRVNAGAGVLHRLNSNDTLSFNANLYVIDYIDGNNASQVPSRSLSFRGNWGRVTSQSISTGLGASLAFFQSEGSEDRRTVALGLTANATWRPWGRWSFFGRLGPNFTVTEENRAAPGGGFTRDRRNEIGLSADLRANYAGAIVSGAAFLSQGLAPDSSGRVVNRSTIGANLGYRTSATSRLSWNGSATVRSALSGASGFQDTYFAATGIGFNQAINSYSSAGISLVARWEDNNADINDEFTAGASIRYSYRLTQYLSASVGYTFRLQDEDRGDDVSHRVFLTLTRPFTLLP